MYDTDLAENIAWDVGPQHVKGEEASPSPLPENPSPAVSIAPFEEEKIDPLGTPLPSPDASPVASPRQSPASFLMSPGIPSPQIRRHPAPFPVGELPRSAATSSIIVPLVIGLFLLTWAGLD